MENIENKVPNGENQDTQNSSFFSENVSSSNGLEVKFPRLRFNTFSSPWNIVTLQNLLCYSKGRCSVKKNFFISTENMLQNYAGVSYYEGKEMVSGVSFSKNDILLANIRPYLKKVWQAEFSGAASTDVLVFHPLKGYPTFIKYIIANDKFINYVMSAVKGSKMPRGDKVHIMSYLTAYPSLLEQQKIANFLSLIDKRIEKQRQLVEALKKYKRGVIKYYFDNILGKHIKLKNILIEVDEKTKINNQHPVISSTKQGLFWQEDYFNKDIASSDNKGYKILRKGQIVFSPQNLWMGNINYNEDFEIGIVSPSYKIYDINKNFDPYFISVLLKTPIAMKEFFLASEQGASIVRRNLNMNLFENIAFQIPSLDKQKDIATRLNKLQKNLEMHVKALDFLNKFKRGLLQQMFI